ncbi:MAG: hypothetical protein IT370_32655 [Deltaproteobacteria bacterium]|nr:hypothetical protein [Deltaproteobacteria bacterium]
MKKTTIVIMAALALGAAGCKKKKKPAPSPSPSASASPGAGASPTPTASPSPSAPATPTATGPQVVLVDGGAGLVQLGCWDPATKNIVDDPLCLKEAPDVVELLTLDGKTVTTDKKEEVVFCEIEGEAPDKNWGFTLPESVPPTDTTAVMLYPKNSSAKIIPGAGDTAATPEQVKAGVAALTVSMTGDKKGDKPPKLSEGEVLMAPPVDLDGDGKPELLFQVQAEKPGADPEMPTQVAGVYADFGDGKLVELFTEVGTPSGGVEIEAVLDLGADGRHELVMQGHWNGGLRQSIISVGADRKVLSIGSVGCDS